jgi:uncharacterized protein (DUF924 family)
MEASGSRSPTGAPSSQVTRVVDMNTVLSYWFDGDQNVNYKTKWFPTGGKDIQHAADVFITATFGDLFRKAFAGELDAWMSEPRSHLALIVVLDQFSRHIFRLENIAVDDPRRQKADAMALAAAEQLRGQLGWEKQFSTAEFVFALMPYRHSATVPRLVDVMANIDAREAAAAEDAELLSRFRKQSTRRLQHLQDRAKVGCSTDLQFISYDFCRPLPLRKY